MVGASAEPVCGTLPWAGILSCEQEDSREASGGADDAVSILLQEGSPAKNACPGGGEDSPVGSSCREKPEQCGAEPQGGRGEVAARPGDRVVLGPASPASAVRSEGSHHSSPGGGWSPVTSLCYRCGA